jgi:hypothetical protein
LGAILSDGQSRAPSAAIMTARLHINLARWSAGAFAAATLAMSTVTQAMSIREFESYPTAEQASIANGIVDQIVNDMQKTDSARAQAVKNYFEGTPRTQDSVPPGMTDFAVELVVIDEAARAHKVDLDRAQIENVVRLVIENMPASAANDNR